MKTGSSVARLFSQRGVNCDNNMFVMHMIPDGFVDLIVTSPPYPGQRGFKKTNVLDWFGFMHYRFEEIARILHPKGVFVLNVMFPKFDGRFDARLFHIMPWVRENYGLNCIDVYMWIKKNPVPSGNMKAHDIPAWEPIFVFAKSEAYIERFTPVRAEYSEKTLVKLKEGNKTRAAGVGNDYSKGHSEAHPDGARLTNVLIMSSSGDQNRPRSKGGSFPRELPRRFILQHTQPDHVVFDPFAGVYTTVHEARGLNRRSFGAEIDSDECKQARQWLGGVWQPPLL